MNTISDYTEPPVPSETNIKGYKEHKIKMNHKLRGRLREKGVWLSGLQGFWWRLRESADWRVMSGVVAPSLMNRPVPMSSVVHQIGTGSRVSIGIGLKNVDVINPHCSSRKVIY